VKVVLFCGGLGMRLRDYADNVPKPMVPIGGRPILWHLMKYYAHQGFSDFILCLGYRGDAIERYFREHPELTEDWSIRLIHTGADANIGQRLRAVQSELAGEAIFLANYADGLSDLSLSRQLAHFHQHGRIAGFASVRTGLSYHTVSAEPNGLVTGIESLAETEIRINGGFFIFTGEIFRYLREGEDLVEKPFQRLIADRQLVSYRHDGFWIAVDTAKDKARVDSLCAEAHPPWMIWKEPVRERCA